MISYALLIASLLADTCVDQKICVNSKLDGANILFTVYGAEKGWAAFGTGSQMAGSTIFNGWKNSTGGATVVALKSSGHSMPQISKDIKVSPISLQVPAPSWAKVAYSFSVSKSAIPAGTYIYALSQEIPKQVDNPNTAFSDHDNYGILSSKVDFGNRDLTNTVNFLVLFAALLL